LAAVKNNSKTVLVTGGAGFIGSHMCKYLLRKGFKVLCLDNLITGSIENIRDINNGDFNYINKDVIETVNLNKDIAEDIDFIFHLASPSSPIDYHRLPVYTMKVGAMGTANILELAKNKGATMLIASTSEIYGDPDINPQTEDYNGNVNPVGPRSVYSEAKRFAEALAVAYHKKEGLDVKIARIFNTYGENMRFDDGRVIPSFIYACLKNDSMVVYGDGSQTRSFCYIDDMLEGLYRLIISDIYQPVNIGNPEEITVLELAKRIKSIINSNSEIVYKELPEEDPKLRKPDITKAKKYLGWQPAVALNDGLKKTIEWFDKRL
jgi:dTDP-glucose 4,6-dehydratase